MPCEERGEGKDEGREGNQVKQPGEERHEKGQDIIMVGLCREEQPSPLVWKVQDMGQGMSGRRVSQVGTEE